MNSGTKAMKCDCTSDPNGNTRGAKYQDQKHGPGYRTHNECCNGWRCLVCGRVKPKK